MGSRCIALGRWLLTAAEASGRAGQPTGCASTDLPPHGGAVRRRRPAVELGLSSRATELAVRRATSVWLGDALVAPRVELGAGVIRI
jgi:hypothetical protein